MAATIESVLTETRVFAPSPEFVRQANVSGMEAYRRLVAEAERDFEGYWARHARELLAWHKPFTRVLDESNAPFYRWFYDGELNASYNCLDRHLATQPEKTAIIFEADDGKVTRITYRELHREVCRMANALRAHGVKVGDRVLIYMPMSIQVIVAMQACARIGATHSVVFAGFSAKSLHERIVDAGATEVITADGQFRGGREIALKPVVDEALAMGGCERVRNVIVYRRTGSPVPMQSPRDKWWDDVVRDQPDTCEPTWVNAEHPLFILYTSGSTGKPKGVQHSTGGYLLGCTLTMKWVFDNKPTDIFWCTADVGWVTGHSYICYGPLSCGTTVVMFEGVPTYPDAGRFWRMIQDHKVTVFYTAPTAIRSLIKAGGDLPKKYDLSSLRILGSVGEPINPEAWMWYHTMVGRERCPIVDTWWQTETGSILITPLPGAIPTKPGSATLPLPGIFADVVDETGQSVGKGKGGILVIRRPWPSMLRTIWGDPERYKKTYWPEDFKGKLYLAGDGASIDEEGYFRIVGRIDDVLNVSGHRLGTMEIESALVANSKLVAEAAVVGRPDELTGEAIVAFVVTKGPRPTGEEAKKVAEELRQWVAKEIGPIAKPKDIRFGDNLPKTRSGKIMRRLLRAIARGEEIKQDVSTLENPAILDQLKQVS
jgi:acetyl-CoA synthetase